MNPNTDGPIATMGLSKNQLLKELADRYRIMNQIPWKRIIGYLLDQIPTHPDHPTYLISAGKALTTWEEFAEAVKSMKNCKAPGIDGIPAELWKGLLCGGSMFLEGES